MSNGQVEHANGLVLQGMKRRVSDRLTTSEKTWVLELRTVPCALRITASRATDESPFFLVYGAKAMVLIEIELHSPRVELYDKEEKLERKRDNLNVTMLKNKEIGSC